MYNFFSVKMVATEESQQNTENTGTFGKLKQTLSSSLLTAQDKGITIFLEIILLYRKYLFFNSQ